jgi:signal transduction histidine kinase/ActR/RegA family two-component response regulator
MRTGICEITYHYVKQFPSITLFAKAVRPHEADRPARTMKIRAYLALMVAAILVPVIVFSTISLNMLLKAERESALKGVRELARTSLVSIDRELTNAEAAIRMLATSTHLSKGEFAEFYEKARYADKVGATWTVLLDENGRLLLSTAAPYGTPLPETTSAERVAKVLEAGVPRISNLIRGAVTQQQLVVVDVPVTTTTGTRYVISQGFRVEHFTRVLTQVHAPAGWLSGVFDRNGMTIAQTAGSGTQQRGGARPDLREAISSGTVGVIRSTRDGDMRLYTVLERSALSGWTVAVGVPEAEIESAARGALTVSILGLFAAILCAGAAGLFFANRLSHSIRHAAQSAQALERGEDLGAPPASGVAEVDEVHAAIIAAGTVVNREKQSRQRAEDERARLFASEREARTIAEQQNRAKDEFLAMLGHELRNPLAAIVNATSVMGLKGIAPESAARAGEIIARQSGHLTRIVDDLLDVGRVHSGKILLERQNLRLDTLVENYVAGVRGSARGAQHAISVATEPAWVDADPTRIEQIIANLLDNAIKYTPAGGSIALAVRVDGGEVALSVCDSGIGIPPELMPHVFDLFVQGVRTLDRAQGGLGVGLALVRRLAAMHGGRVAAHSDGPGQGSCFELRLPRVDEGAALAAMMPAAPASSHLSVLVIEDNDDGREMMAMMLEAHDYRVITAVDGAEGLRLAEQRRPDVVLVDIGLPGIDGYEVARRLRANPATSMLRLVALTGYGLESDRARALAAGFDAHLVKPVDLALLMEVLEQAEASVNGA